MKAHAQRQRMTDMNDHGNRAGSVRSPDVLFFGRMRPKVDKKLVMFSAALEWLRSRGVAVRRYNPTQEYPVPRRRRFTKPRSCRRT